MLGNQHFGAVEVFGEPLETNVTGLLRDLGHQVTELTEAKDALQQKVTELQRHVADKDLRIADAEKRHRQLEQLVADGQAVVGVRESSLAALELQVRELHASKAVLEESIAALRARIAEKAGSLAAFAARQEALERQLAERESDLGAQRSGIVALTAQREALEQQLAEQRSDSAVRARDLRESSAVSAAKDAVIEGLRADKARLESVLELTERQATDGAAALRDLQGLADVRQAELTAQEGLVRRLTQDLAEGARAAQAQAEGLVRKEEQIHELLRERERTAKGQSEAVGRLERRLRDAETAKEELMRQMSTTAHKMEQLQCDRDDLAEQLARHAADRDRRDAARAAADEELQEAKKQAALAECVRHGLEAELKRLRAAMAEQERALHEAVTERLELVHSVEKLESFAGRRLAEVHALKADRDAAQGGRTVAAAQEALAVMEQQLKEREAAEARLLERLETAERALVAAEEDRTRSDAAARELREALGRRDAEAQAAGAELQRAQAQARAAEADLRGQERAAAEAEQRLREALEAQGDEAAKLRALVQQQKAAEELLLQRQQSLEAEVQGLKAMKEQRSGQVQSSEAQAREWCAQVEELRKANESLDRDLGWAYRTLDSAKDKIKQEKLKAADLMDELERKTHQQESLEEINQQMIADMTKRMSAQIRDCPVWKETLAQLLHDTVRPSPGAAAPHPPGAPKPGFLRGLFGHKDEAGAADHRQASLERGSSDGDTSAGSRRESSVVMRRRELRKKEELGQRTASQGSSDPGLSRSGSLSLSSARSSGEFAVPPEPGALEEVAALKAQNKLLESNMHDMQRAMNQCLDQKYDEIKRKYFGEILQLRSDQKVLADAKDKYKAMVLRLEDKLLEAERKLCCFDSPRSMHQSFNSSPRTPRQQ